MDLEVTISEQALQSMALAACEAYVFGKNGKRKPVETYAHLWGSRRRQKGSKTEYVHVDRISVCVSAKAKKDRVEVSTDVIALQDGIVKRWSPHVSLLGNFHTHPYESWEETTGVQGWEFSEVDKYSLLTNKQLWKCADGDPIALVMAIAELQRVHKSSAQFPAPHRGGFNIGQYRFSISAGAGRQNRKGKRRFDSKDVTLHIGQYFHNEAGSRI